MTWHPAIGVAVVLLIIVFRRWRHLLVFTICLFFLEIVGGLIYNGLSRPRPYGVPIIGRWDGYSAPARSWLALTFFLMAAVYCLVVPGRPRSYAKAAVAAVVARPLPVPALPGRRPSGRRAVRRRAGRGHTGGGVPVLHPQRAVPRLLPPRPDRARGRDRQPRRGDPAGRPRPARADRPGDQAGRPGVIGRVDAAAADRRGRPGRVPVRQALHPRPRSRRPVVQAVAHHLVRRPGRRAPVPFGAAADPVRGLRAAAAPGRRDPHRRAARDRGDHAGTRVPARHRVLHRGGRARRGRRRTTASSTRGSC